MRRADRLFRLLLELRRGRVVTASERTVRPLALAFYPPVWLLIAWCELRVDFRNFRLDRCAALTVTERRFVDEPGKTLAEFLARMEARHDEHERR